MILEQHQTAPIDLDGMTQLFNKVAFGRNLENLIASNRNNNSIQASRRKSDSDNGQSQRKVAVLMLDLDGFKRTNDEISHAAGDAVLMKVAEILKSELRFDQKTIIGRLGGDEFVIAIEVEDKEEAQEIQKRLDHIFNTIKPLSPEQATQTIFLLRKAKMGQSQNLPKIIMNTNMFYILFQRGRAAMIC